MADEPKAQDDTVPGETLSSRYTSASSGKREIA